MDMQECIILIVVQSSAVRMRESRGRTREREILFFRLLAQPSFLSVFLILRVVADAFHLVHVVLAYTYPMKVKRRTERSSETAARHKRGDFKSRKPKASGSAILPSVCMKIQ